MATKQRNSLDLNLKNLSISDPSASVFVKGEVPCILNKFMDKDKNIFLGIHMLCFTGIDENSYEFEVSKSNDSVTIDYRPPALFFDPSWLENLDKSYDSNSACQQSYQHVVDDFFQLNSTKEVLTSFKVKVPFKIESNARYAGVNLHGDKCIFTLIFGALEKRVKTGKVKINISSPMPRSSEKKDAQKSPTVIVSDDRFAFARMDTAK